MLAQCKPRALPIPTAQLGIIWTGPYANAAIRAVSNHPAGVGRLVIVRCLSSSSAPRAARQAEVKDTA